MVNYKIKVINIIGKFGFYLFKKTISRYFLMSNVYIMNKKSKYIGKLTSFEKNHDRNELNSFYSNLGYLVIKNFYNRRDILTLEKEILENIKKKKNDIGISEVLSVMQEFDSYQRVVNSLELKEFIETLFNCKCNLYTRKVMRFKSPITPFSTGGHYDFTYLRRSSGKVFNVWIPIGDIMLDQGGISYLENSIPISKELELNYIKDSIKLSPDLRTSAYNKLSKRHEWITKNILKYSKEKNRKWLVSNFKAGDIVIHSPYVIHATFANANSKNETKFSTDIRFDYSKEEADERWNKKWTPFDGL